MKLLKLSVVAMLISVVFRKYAVVVQALGLFLGKTASTNFSTQGTAGVGILLAKKFVENVIPVERVNDRFMLIKLLFSQTIVTVVSAYAPRQGLGDSEKDTFYDIYFY